MENWIYTISNGGLLPISEDDAACIWVSVQGDKLRWARDLFPELENKKNKKNKKKDWCELDIEEHVSAIVLANRGGWDCKKGKVKKW